ncbi:hypothetical protein ACFXB3_02740 [Streptomyces sp. NPDC059447]|uniref:hypothetical protein n=1 Tax=Streptomyces sp. NPDC059447 TaxID=3346834 RepID=UPI0036B565BA
MRHPGRLRTVLPGLVEEFALLVPDLRAGLLRCSENPGGTGVYGDAAVGPAMITLTFSSPDGDPAHLDLPPPDRRHHRTTLLGRADQDASVAVTPFHHHAESRPTA